MTLTDTHGREIQLCVGGPIDGHTVLAASPPPTVASPQGTVHYERRRIDGRGPLLVVPATWSNEKVASALEASEAKAGVKLVQDAAPAPLPIDADHLFRRRPISPTDVERNQLHADAQSLAFYADISAFLRDALPGGTYSLLDVGPRSGSGLALLRLLHHPLSFTSTKFDPVEGVDIDPVFERVATRLYPDIGAKTADAFKLNGKWDIVMSSHTIEHVDEPMDFLAKLERLAKRFVVVACPFEEQDLIVYHRNRITYKMLTSAGFWNIKVYRSDHWFNSMVCIAMKAL